MAATRTPTLLFRKSLQTLRRKDCAQAESMRLPVAQLLQTRPAVQAAAQTITTTVHQAVVRAAALAAATQAAVTANVIGGALSTQAVPILQAAGAGKTHKAVSATALAAAKVKVVAA